MLNFEDINKSEKVKFCKPYISELTVLVKVKIDNLNDCSNPISSKIRKLDKIKRLRKKDINIKNDILIFSSVILFSELKMVLFITLLGLVNFIISKDVIFSKI